MTDRVDLGAVWPLQALEYFAYIIWQKPDVFAQNRMDILAKNICCRESKACCSDYSHCADWAVLNYHHNHHLHVHKGLGVFPVPWSSNWSCSLHLFFRRPFGLHFSACFDISHELYICIITDFFFGAASACVRYDSLVVIGLCLY